MREVLGGKLQSRLAAQKGSEASAGEGQIGGSCMSLSTVGFSRPKAKSCSLETILDGSAPLTRHQLFHSTDSLALYSTRSKEFSSVIATPHSCSDSLSRETSVSCENVPGGPTRSRLPVVSVGGLPVTKRSCPLRPHSVGSCLDIVIETKEEDVRDTRLQGRSTSCINVTTPAEQHRSLASRPPSFLSYHQSFSSYPPSSSSSALAKVQGSHTTAGPSGPRPAFSTSNLWTFAAPAVVRRCLSSLDVSKPSRPASLLKPPFCVPSRSSNPSQPKPEHSKTLSPLLV